MGFRQGTASAVPKNLKISGVLTPEAVRHPLLISLTVGLHFGSQLTQLSGGGGGSSRWRF